MKDPRLYAAIEQLRLNKKNRESRPYSTFHKKNDRSIRLIVKIFKMNIPNTLFYEALSQFIISDITAFEVYFKDIFLSIFELHKDPKELILRFNDKKFIKQTFDIEDLVKVGIEDYSIPEIILQHQSFQRLDHINDVFSRIIGEDFFSALKNRKFHEGMSTEFELSDDFIPKLREYLDLRHNIVHDWHPKIELSGKYVEDLHLNLMMFVTAADQYLEWEYLSKNLKAIPKRKKKKIKNKK